MSISVNQVSTVNANANETKRDEVVVSSQGTGDKKKEAKVVENKQSEKKEVKATPAPKKEEVKQEAKQDSKSDMKNKIMASEKSSLFRDMIKEVNNSTLETMTFNHAKDLQFGERKYIGNDKDVIFLGNLPNGKSVVTTDVDGFINIFNKLVVNNQKGLKEAALQEAKAKGDAKQIKEIEAMSYDGFKEIDLSKAPKGKVPEQAILAAIQPMNFAADRCVSQKDEQKLLFEYLSNYNNRVTCWEQAVKDHDGDTTNNCAYWLANALHNLGFLGKIPNGRVTELRDGLKEQGWVERTDFNNLTTGGIVTTRNNTHCYVFLRWADKGAMKAIVYDEMSVKKGYNEYERYINGHSTPGSADYQNPAAYWYSYPYLDTTNYKRIYKELETYLSKFNTHISKDSYLYKQITVDMEALSKAICHAEPDVNVKVPGALEVRLYDKASGKLLNSYWSGQYEGTKVKDVSMKIPDGYHLASTCIYTNENDNSKIDMPMDKGQQMIGGKYVPDQINTFKPNCHYYVYYYIEKDAPKQGNLTVRLYDGNKVISEYSKGGVAGSDLGTVGMKMPKGYETGYHLKETKVFLSDNDKNGHVVDGKTGQDMMWGKKVPGEIAKYKADNRYWVYYYIEKDAPQVAHANVKVYDMTGKDPNGACTTGRQLTNAESNYKEDGAPSAGIQKTGFKIDDTANKEGIKYIPEDIYSVIINGKETKNTHTPDAHKYIQSLLDNKSGMKYGANGSNTEIVFKLNKFHPAERFKVKVMMYNVTTGKIVVPNHEISEGEPGTNINGADLAVPKGCTLVKVMQGYMDDKGQLQGKPAEITKDKLPTKIGDKNIQLIYYIKQPEHTNTIVTQDTTGKVLVPQISVTGQPDEAKPLKQDIPAGYHLVNVTEDGKKIEQKDIPQKIDANADHHVIQVVEKDKAPMGTFNVNVYENSNGKANPIKALGYNSTAEVGKHIEKQGFKSVPGYKIDKLDIIQDGKVIKTLTDMKDIQPYLNTGANGDLPKMNNGSIMFLTLATVQKLPYSDYVKGNITFNYYISKIPTHNNDIVVVDKDGKVVTPKVTVTGHPGDKKPLEAKVPDGYHIVKVTLDGKEIPQDKIPQAIEDKDHHVVVVVEKNAPQTSNAVVKLVDVTNPDKPVTMNTRNTNGKIGSEFDPNEKVPEGYHLVKVVQNDKDADPKKLDNHYLNGKTNTIIWQVAKNSTNTIVVVDEKGNVISPKTSETGEPGKPYNPKYDTKGKKIIKITVDGKPVKSLADIPKNFDGKNHDIVITVQDPHTNDVVVKDTEGKVVTPLVKVEGYEGEKKELKPVVPKGYHVVKVTVDGKESKITDIPQAIMNKDTHSVVVVAKNARNTIKVQTVDGKTVFNHHETPYVEPNTKEDLPYQIPKNYHIVKVTLNGKEIKKEQIPTVVGETDQNVIITVEKDPGSVNVIVKDTTGKIWENETQKGVIDEKGNIKINVPEGYQIIKITQNGKVVTSAEQTFTNPENKIVYIIAKIPEKIVNKDHTIIVHDKEQVPVEKVVEKVVEKPVEKPAPPAPAPEQPAPVQKLEDTGLGEVANQVAGEGYVAMTAGAAILAEVLRRNKKKRK